MTTTIELTKSEYDALNAVEQILINHFNTDGEVLMLSFHAGWDRISATYFTPNKVQHSGVWPEEDRTFAGKIAHCLELRADEEGRADEIRAQRVENLRRELAALTGDAA